MNFKPEDFENVGIWHSGGGVLVEVAEHKATGLGIGLTSDCLVVYDVTEDGDFEESLASIAGNGDRWVRFAQVNKSGSRAELYKQASELAESVCEDICDAWSLDVGEAVSLALRCTYGKDKSDGAGWPLRN